MYLLSCEEIKTIIIIIIIVIIIIIIIIITNRSRFVIKVAYHVIVPFLMT